MTAASVRCGTLGSVGKLQWTVKFKDKLIPLLCYVTKSNTDLLGIDWLEELGLSNLPIDTFCKLVQTSQQYTDTLMKQFLAVAAPSSRLPYSREKAIILFSA